METRCRHIPCLLLPLSLTLVLLACRREEAPSPTAESPCHAGDTWTRPTDGAVMVCVPAGEFLMGSSNKDIDAVLAGCSNCRREWFADEQPQHTVYLDAFWIDQTEVTYAQYDKCVAARACSEWRTDMPPDHPVEFESWERPQAYAAWVGGRLPTEAEWEKACGGTDGRIYPWGDDVPDCTRANYGRCLDEGAAAVGSYPTGASPYGVLDMAGNVAEWVADWYSRDYYRSSPARNPQGPRPTEQKVLRGGGHHAAAWEVRCADRSASGWGDLEKLVTPFGFRVVVDVSSSGP